ncbi:MMPL family transporter [Horticoccus sp. 23ND18S-11]|uniref:MMPL family transporter n=1 Tax=Horticoccus sp. 23ND18S-11 TaxID=3391832 RepID=UPI0039C9AB6B
MSEPPRQKLWARLTLGVVAAFCVIWMLRLDYARKISTNVLDLIPAAEQSPEIGLVRNFASNVQARVMLLALSDPRTPGAPPAAAAATFAAELRQSPAFAEIVLMGDASAGNALGGEVFAHRFEWLLPGWLAEREREFARTGEPRERFSAWLATRTATQLETFLNRPEATALQDVIPRDPLLLVPALVERARLLDAPGANAGGHALIWARITASPFAEEGQGPVFAAIEQALARVRAQHGAVELRWSGVNRFAAASRARIETEMRWLNLVSIAAVLGVSSLFVRRVFKLLHLVPVILLSILGAWTLSTLVFDRLHILVFVIGSLLSGVAVDYGFYIYMQPSLYPDEPYAAKLRRILKPLLASCLTTVIGFSLLLFSELPLIRQIGVFVSAGLLCALATAMLYFAQLERPLLEGRQFGGAGSRAVSPLLRWGVRGLFAAIALVAVFGPLRLHWRDDVRELDLPATELQANETALRALFGESTGRTIFLTHGATLPEARQRLDAFLAQQQQATPGVAAASVGLLLPTEADWRALPARLAALPAFATDLGVALEQRGFTAAAFAPFFSAWGDLQRQPPAGDYAALAAGLGRALTGPLALLSNTREAPFWFLTIVEQPAVSALPGLHTIGLNQLQSLNDLFTRYRWSALQLSVIGLALVILSVFAIYPFRRGLRIALIPAGSCFFVFGLLGLTGQTLNLFHLLGSFLGVCLSHNYAIFSSDNSAAGQTPPVPVRLSALSTAASFGVLGFSRIPVIHALGLTVALIVLTALAIVELEPLTRRSRA